MLSFCLQWLYIAGNGRTSGAVTYMSDADIAFLLRKISEHFRNQSHAFECLHLLSIRNRDTRAFLTSVLQSEKSIVGFQNGLTIRVKNAKHTTFFMRFIIIAYICIVHDALLSLKTDLPEMSCIIRTFPRREVHMPLHTCRWSS